MRLGLLLDQDLCHGILPLSELAATLRCSGRGHWLPCTVARPQRFVVGEHVDNHRDEHQAHHEPNSPISMRMSQEVMARMRHDHVGSRPGSPNRACFWPFHSFQLDDTDSLPRSSFKAQLLTEPPNPRLWRTKLTIIRTRREAIRMRWGESSASNIAILMLGEPPLIARMRGLADFMRAPPRQYRHRYVTSSDGGLKLAPSFLRHLRQPESPALPSAPRSSRRK